MDKKQNPASGGTLGGDGNVVAGNSASLPKLSTRRRQRQRAWSNAELRQLRKRQRDALPHVGERHRGIENLPPFTVQHVADSEWWLLTFADGDMVAMRTGSFRSNARFNAECHRQLSRVFARISPNDVWVDRINQAMRLAREGGHHDR